MRDAFAHDGAPPQSRVTRRMAFRIAAGVSGLALMIAGLRAFAPAIQRHRWEGEVLGAWSVLDVWHIDAAFARAAIAKARIEIDRLENIFSLYRPKSEIARLNAAGRLDAPSRELLSLVEEGRRLSEISGGAFDISVQPLWKLYEAEFWTGRGEQPEFSARARDVSRAMVNYRNIDSGSRSIAFAKPGMAITLNSMAQGFITDRITELLRNEGFESAVVDLGEFRTIGRHPDGRPWRFSAGESDGDLIDLENMALAVSRGTGTVFEPSGRHHHIFDPRTGESAHGLYRAAVIAESAAIADGLATAMCAAGPDCAKRLLAAYPRARAILTLPSGRTEFAT